MGPLFRVIAETEAADSSTTQIKRQVTLDEQYKQLVTLQPANASELEVYRGC